MRAVITSFGSLIMWRGNTYVHLLGIRNEKMGHTDTDGKIAKGSERWLWINHMIKGQIYRDIRGFSLCVYLWKFSLDLMG